MYTSKALPCLLTNQEPTMQMRIEIQNGITTMATDIKLPEDWSTIDVDQLTKRLVSALMMMQAHQVDVDKTKRKNDTQSANANISSG